LSDIVPYLPHVNASLNALATVLLVLGLVQIKLRREARHKWTMLACFGVSALFLVSYLVYHFSIGGSRKFPDYPPATVRYAYYAILVSHIVLAITVPFLAIASIWLGLADKRAAHLRLAKWTFPIWLYVSVTGVVVYLLLYQVYVQPPAGDKIEASVSLAPTHAILSP
jgi:putative membrane protein